MKAIRLKKKSKMAKEFPGYEDFGDGSPPVYGIAEDGCVIFIDRSGPCAAYLDNRDPDGAYQYPGGPFDTAAEAEEYITGLPDDYHPAEHGMPRH